MEIKGNIGEEVYIKATIQSIHIGDDGINYFVHIVDGDSNDYANVKLENVKFNEQKQEEKKAPEVKKDVVPTTPPKKRGRPRKTTVDDLVKKAKM